MRKIALLGICAFAAMLGMSGVAGAVSAPPADWSGLYVGPSIGVATNRDNGINHCINPSGVVDGTGCAIPAFGNIHANGGLAGGQIGYNFQADRFVFGPEVQFITTTITGSSVNQGPFSYVGGGASSANSTFNAMETIGWMADARLRLGFAISEKALVYLSGGYARMNGSVLSNFTFNGSTPTYIDQENVQRNGFIGGIGGEWRFQPRTSVRLELSEYNFPSLTTEAVEVPTFGTNYYGGKEFQFRGYTVTGGVNLKI